MIENNRRLFLYSTTNTDRPDLSLPFACHRRCCPRDKCGSIFFYFLWPFSNRVYIYFFYRRRRTGLASVIQSKAFVWYHYHAEKKCSPWWQSSFTWSMSFAFSSSLMSPSHSISASQKILKLSAPQLVDSPWPTCSISKKHIDQCVCIHAEHQLQFEANRHTTRRWWTTSYEIGRKSDALGVKQKLTQMMPRLNYGTE